MMRYITLAVMCLAGPAVAQQPSHIEGSFGWTRQPSTNIALDARLSGAAAQYRSYAPIPRIALYDVAYPKDSAEAVALGGNAVLVVTAVVQDSTEIPLRRMYVITAAGAVQELPLIAAMASYTSDSLIRTTFGRFRLDAVYLLPLPLRVSAGDLLTDFGAHRDGFRLTHFDGQVPDALRRLGRLPSTSSTPAAATIWSFMRREYPDVASTLGPR